MTASSFSNRLTCLFISLLTMAISFGCSNEKQVSFKSGGMTHTFAQGKDAIPKDFPLPIYAGAVVTGSVSSEGDNKEHSRFLMLSTKDPLDKVSEFYQKELKSRNWEIENVQTWTKLISISASKKDMEANVMLAEDSGKTTISLSTGKSIEDSSDKATEDDLENYKPEKLTPPTD